VTLLSPALSSFCRRLFLGFLFFFLSMSLHHRHPSPFFSLAPFVFMTNLLQFVLPRRCILFFCVAPCTFGRRGTCVCPSFQIFFLLCFCIFTRPRVLLSFPAGYHRIKGPHFLPDFFLESYFLSMCSFQITMIDRRHHATAYTFLGICPVFLFSSPS